MGKDKKEKLVNDIQGTDCYEDVDTAETTSDEEGDCTNVNQELSALEEELQKVREERDLYLSMAQRLQAEYDNFRNRNAPEATKTYKGMEMVTKQFLDILGKLGIEEIEALDQPFDTTYHDAVMQVEAENEDQRNKVVEVLLKGYKSKDKVIRYSMVKVAI